MELTLRTDRSVLFLLPAASPHVASPLVTSRHLTYQVTNKIMFVVFTCMVLVTTVSLVGYLIWSAQNDDELYYLCLNYEDAPVPLFR